MKTFLLSAMIIVSGISATAQNPTIVTTASNCTVFRSFDVSDEGFSSPSIYSDGNDVSFYWNTGGGAEIESSGLLLRSASLISPVYFQTIEGQVTVGFSYSAPAGTEFRVRIISGIMTPPLEIAATTANGPVYTALPGTSGNICLLLTDADLHIGMEVRAEFTFRATLPGNISFDNLALTVAAGPLPVTFEGFVAQKLDDQSVRLLWDVGTEVNVKGYYVESSFNGADFTNVGYVTASGKDIYSLDYPGKLQQTMFFRVKNVDFDGRSKYTPIIKVYAKDQTGAQIQAYPVPATDQVTIQHNKTSGKAVISLMSPDGKLLQRKTAMENAIQTQLYIGNLGKGIYIVNYDDGQGNVQNIKITKN